MEESLATCALQALLTMLFLTPDFSTAKALPEAI